MAKEEVINKATAPDRLELIWQLTAKSLDWLEFKPKKPDLKDLGAQMEKAKKPAEFVLTWDGKKLALIARVGSSVTALGSQNVAAEKDPAKKYASLKNISDHTLMLPASELPPDPAAVGDLRAKVKQLKEEIERWEGERKKLPRKYDQLDQGQQEIGLGHWAKKKGFDRFPRFLMAVDWGRDAKYIVEEFVKHGAPSPVGPKLKATTRDAILETHAAGQKPDFTQARKEIATLVDSFMMPPYVKANQAGIDEHVKRLKAELKAEAGKLKQLVGR